LLSRLTKDASKVTLVGDGKTLVERAKQDPERKILPKQAYESAAEIDRVVCNMIDIHGFLKKNDEERLPDILFNTTGNTEFCSDEVRAKLRSHAEEKESRIASYKKRTTEAIEELRSVLDSKGRAFLEKVRDIRRILSELRRKKEENGLESILEEVDREIKSEKDGSQE
jgi:hypothetical protein